MPRASGARKGRAGSTRRNHAGRAHALRPPGRQRHLLPGFPVDPAPPSLRWGQCVASARENRERWRRVIRRTRRAAARRHVGRACGRSPSGDAQVFFSAFIRDLKVDVLSREATSPRRCTLLP
jgi:hypothetical protein